MDWNKVSSKTVRDGSVYTVEELKKYARELGVSCTGTKATIVQNLLAVKPSTLESTKDIQITSVCSSVSASEPIVKSKSLDEVRMKRLFNDFRTSNFIYHSLPVLSESIKTSIKQQLDVTDDFILTENLIEKIYNAYDQIFFYNYLSEALNRHNITLRFGVTSGLKVIGKCCIKGCSASINLSKESMDSLFKNGIKSHLINGVVCKTRLDCLLCLFEHELTHLIISYSYPKSIPHSKQFKKFAKDVFGHTDFRHSLLSGDGAEIAKKQGLVSELKVGDVIQVGDFIGKVMNVSKRTFRLENEREVKRFSTNTTFTLLNIECKSMKLDVKIGDLVRMSQGIKSYEGTVISIASLRIKIKLPDERLVLIPKTWKIEKIDSLKYTPKTPENTFKVGDLIRFPFAGGYFTGKITNVLRQNLRVEAYGINYNVPKIHARII